MYIYKCSCFNIYIHTNIYTHEWICIYVFIYIFVWICVDVVDPYCRCGGISDRGISSLVEGCPRLEIIDLKSCLITDVAIDSIAKVCCAFFTLYLFSTHMLSLLIHPLLPTIVLLIENPVTFIEICSSFCCK
jgi:hypothetical protein